MEEQTQTSMNRTFLFILGFVMVVFGMTLVLKHWVAAVLVFKGIMPAAIAVGGLVVMFAATIKK